MSILSCGSLILLFKQISLDFVKEREFLLVSRLSWLMVYFGGLWVVEQVVVVS
jgi:hypothetical protein